MISLEWNDFFTRKHTYADKSQFNLNAIVPFVWQFIFIFTVYKCIIQWIAVHLQLYVEDGDVKCSLLLNSNYAWQQHFMSTSWCRCWWTWTGDALCFCHHHLFSICDNLLTELFFSATYCGANKWKHFYVLINDLKWANFDDGLSFSVPVNVGCFAIKKGNTKDQHELWIACKMHKDASSLSILFFL